jgi:hypothetical protein
MWGGYEFDIIKLLLLSSGFPVHLCMFWFCLAFCRVLPYEAGLSHKRRGYLFCGPGLESVEEEEESKGEQ